MKIRRLVQYCYGLNRLEFIRLKKNAVPGFSHRVVLNGIAVDWLANDSKPDLKSAAYFFQKHKEKMNHADA